MNGQHLGWTEEDGTKKTCQWLKRGRLNRETEKMILAAQDQTKEKNYRKAKVDRSSSISIIRMYKEKEDSVGHVVNECSKKWPKQSTRNEMKGWLLQYIDPDVRSMVLIP